MLTVCHEILLMNKHYRNMSRCYFYLFLYLLMHYLTYFKFFTSLFQRQSKLNIAEAATLHNLLNSNGACWWLTPSFTYLLGSDTRKSLFTLSFNLTSNHICLLLLLILTSTIFIGVLINFYLFYSAYLLSLSGAWSLSSCVLNTAARVLFPKDSYHIPAKILYH